MASTRLDDLIARAQSRDPQAFDALLDHYNGRLYGYFYRLTGSRHDAEDLLQEVFVRLVRTIGQYDHRGRFDNWLFRIAANLGRDRLRRLKTARAAGLNSSGQVGPEGDDSDPLDRIPDRQADEPADELGKREQIARMQLALQQLPEHEREVICLRHFSQMAFQEIADTLQVPLGTALARGHRGLARLRELMES